MQASRRKNPRNWARRRISEIINSTLIHAEMNTG